MPNSKRVKPRAYTSQLRAEGARETRASILEAAHALFIQRGYAAVTMAEIAGRAGVSLDTVYASLGKKVDVFRLLLETAISGTGEAVAAEQREYVQTIRSAKTAREKLDIYAEAVAAIAPRLAPLYAVLAHAAHADRALAAQWRAISSRRAANMKLFAHDLRGTGELRADLSDQDVADIVWTMNSPEYYAMLVQERRWPVNRFRAWLYDAWCRLLLPSGHVAAGSGITLGGSFATFCARIQTCAVKER